MEGGSGKVPSFRPQVQIPQLQVLALTEATELTDVSPKVYIYDRSNGSVDEARSKSFQEEWKSLWVNYQMLFASLWGQLSGLGFLQFGYDPFADMGFGKIWCRHKPPDLLDIDPAAETFGDATYVVASDRLYPDRIAYYWPETGTGIAPEGITGKGDGTQNSPANAGGLPPKLRMPPGPMRQGDNAIQSETLRADGRLLVRYLFIDDRTVELVKEEAGGDSASLIERAQSTGSRGEYSRRLKWPNKRLIVCVTGRTSRCVADGDNPTPGNTYPFVPFYGLPPLSGFYPPPPTRYTKDLQALAERTLTQIFENVVRLNNGIWFIDKGTGIDLGAFGGLPGEVCEINDNSRPPTCVTPQVINESVMKLVQWMLTTQKELQGFNQSREGNAQAGNLSADLFEASIFQSKALTRCRAKLLAHSVHCAANLVFNFMATYYTGSRAYPVSDGGFSLTTWKPLYGEMAKNVRLHIDPTSLLPISQAAMRQLAPTLKEQGVIDNETLLEALGIPDAANIAARTNRELALAALQKVKKR